MNARTTSAVVGALLVLLVAGFWLASEHPTDDRAVAPTDPAQPSAASLPAEPAPPDPAPQPTGASAPAPAAPAPSARAAHEPSTEQVGAAIGDYDTLGELDDVIEGGG